MKYSFNTWAMGSYPTWLPAYPLDLVVRRLARIGYDAVEVGCTAPHAWPDYLDSTERKALLSVAHENDIVYSSICSIMGVGPGNNPASANPRERAWALQHLKDVVDLAADLECRKLIYVAGFAIYGTRRQDAWGWTLDALEAIADYSAPKGVTIVVEPTSSDSNLVDSIDDARLLRDQCGRDNVGIMFDTAHAFFRHDQPVDYVHQLGDELSHVHLADYDRTAPGDGGYDFTDLMQALRDVSYTGYVTIEAGFTKRSTDPFAVARRGLAYLKEVEAVLV